MTVLAHLSDLHFGRINRGVIKALLGDLQELGPDLVVVSGDLTQRARRREYLKAQAFLRRLPAPYLAVPGNHDIPAYDLWSRFTRPYARFQRHVSADLHPFRLAGDAAVLGLNSARRALLDWNWKHGSISRRQIAHAERIFAGVPGDRIRVLVTHHPFLPPPSAPGTRLIGRAAGALARLSAAGVDLLLAGHLHQAYFGDVTSFHRHVGRSIVVAQASTATSSRTRGEPNAYNAIRLAPDAMELESRVWRGARFVVESRSRFARREGGWRRI